MASLYDYFNNTLRDFPGGTVIKNLPANVGNTGPSPGPGRSHMPQSNWARVPQLLSLHSRAKPVSHNYWARTSRAPAPQQQKPPQWEARALQRTVAPDLSD